MASRKGLAVLVLFLALVACAERPREATAPSRSVTRVTPAPTAFSPPTTHLFKVESVTVSRVIDGDTAQMQMSDGRLERIRFIGVDSPESTSRTEPYGREAAAFTARTIEGKAVFLEYDVQLRDRYGRLLAYVWLARPARGDESEVRANLFNARLLIEGFAQVLTIPPNVRYVDLFRTFQEEARTAGRGLWDLAATSPSAEVREGTTCHPSYPDVCIPPSPPDLDCPEVPHRNFRVRYDLSDPDPHGFDRDKDGLGCER